MKGDPDVVAALNAVYGLILPTVEEAHRQEHQYEAEGYKKASDWFDAVERKFMKDPPQLCHYVMNRINCLGGTVNGVYAFEPAPAKGIAQIDVAVGSIVERLYEIHMAYAAVCTAAESAEPYDDYVTQAMVWDHLGCVEKLIGKFEDRLAQIAELGVEGYLREMFDK